MSSYESRHRFFDADLLRRLIHVVIFAGIVVGIRACGGAASAEDQLGAGTQWFAERTGLITAKETWDKSVRPPIAALTGSASQSLYGTVGRALDRVELVTDQGSSWLTQTSRGALDAVAGSLRAIFMPRSTAAEQPQTDHTEGQTQPTASPAR